MHNLSPDERKALIAQIDEALASNTISIGKAVKKIRTELYGMNQNDYAKFINISDKTLRDVEKGNTDPRLSIVNKLLAPGSFQVSARAVKRVI
ncbi:DNA-binding protein [Aliidiomarina shirensis]|jgi:DNA-binding XRE family transcriptional regulator|uniref:DNA-binding protein n=1 Tax=Aliidiomarina shirensis TaxID=1048642 RepID=A0A432WQ64_9GAMM|nr:helix-turn-helix domain-containing protein [Aliidiomarina shirensis]RUO35942.1 DNA-binding protein [Aliidiomarina shirensis]